jgi:serine/threonine-protein kinase RsbW
MMRGKCVRLDFPSSLDVLDLVQSISDQMGRAGGLDDEGLHWLNVAVRECVINAINHGNGKDPDKRVHLEFTPFEDEVGPGVSVRVRDEGPGFDPGTLPDCCAPENLLKGSGRGIFLIRSFMDQMHLRRAPEGGMEVVMVKRAQPQQEQA